MALLHEHGLSFCIETPGHTVLFDTGQSGQFIQNAAQLRIDLSLVEQVVLSHGHYDHSGGLTALLAVNTHCEVVVGKGFFVDKYAQLNGGYEFLGNNFTKDDLLMRGVVYSELAEPLRELVPGVYAMGDFPRIHPDEVINTRFKLHTEAGFEPDPFDDEILLVVDTPQGLVVLLGCSHPGMRNMLDAVKKRFSKPIYAVLGGTHLVEASNPVVDASSEYLAHEGIEIIGVSHCTGKVGMKVLSESTGSYFHNRTGSALIVQ